MPIKFEIFGKENEQKRYRLEIDGKPQPQERWRMASKTRSGRRFLNPIRYDPLTRLKKSLHVEISQYLRVNYKGFKPISGPIALNVICLMPIPRSWPQYKRTAIERFGLRVWHWVKPDVSNLLKFPEDTFNGILWEDDSQIANVTVNKFYHPVPKTVLEFKQLSIPDWNQIKIDLKKLNLNGD